VHKLDPAFLGGQVLYFDPVPVPAAESHGSQAVGCFGRAHIGKDVEVDPGKPLRQLGLEKIIHVSAEGEPVVPLVHSFADNLEGMAGLASDAVEKSSGAEPAPVEVIGLDEVSDGAEELFEPAAAIRAVCGYHKKLSRSVLEKKSLNVVKIPGPELVTVQFLPPWRPGRGPGQKLFPEFARKAHKDKNVRIDKVIFKDIPRRIFKLTKRRTHQPVEKALFQVESRHAQLFGCVDFVLGDGPDHIRTADLVEVPILKPVPVDAVPVIRVSVELAGGDNGWGDSAGGACVLKVLQAVRSRSVSSQDLEKNAANKQG
jgi:hypothetical protein